MKCLICKVGETSAGHATVTLGEGETVVVFKEVPAQICQNCGETYTDTPTTDLLLERAWAAQEAGVEVAVQHFKAA